jgi:hypothetical protein
MSKDSLFREGTDPTVSSGFNSARTILAEHALRSSMDNGSSWQSRALSGVTDGAREAWDNKTGTALMIGSGLTIGAVLQTGLNNAELVGGKVGMVARAGKTAAIAVPLILSGVKIAGADDSAHEAGKMAFEMGLFLGAGKLGTMADRVPLAGKVLGPRPTTSVPERLNFQVIGNKVEIKNGSNVYGSVQVRLSNGKGFIASGERMESANLIKMPEHIPGAGRISYTAESTTLTNGHGIYSRSVHGGTTSILRDGQLVTARPNGGYTLQRDGGPLRTETVTFHPRGVTEVEQGSFHSGRHWLFGEDGSISMKSLPHGKYRFNLNPDGEGTYLFTHGTSAGIAGRVGPRSRYAPLQRDSTPVSLNPPADGSLKPVPFPLPDITPLPAAVTKNLFEARSVLDAIASQALK